MAPEINEKKAYKGESVDLFAAGIILFIMLSGSPPFSKACLQDPYYKLIAQKKFEQFWKAHERFKGANFFSQTFKDLINNVLCYKADERMKIDEIFARIRSGFVSLIPSVS